MRRPEMDEAFASRLNREDNRRAQARRIAGLAKVKDVDRFRGVLAAVFCGERSAISR